MWQTAVNFQPHCKDSYSARSIYSIHLCKLNQISFFFLESTSKSYFLFKDVNERARNGRPVVCLVFNFDIKKFWRKCKKKSSEPILDGINRQKKQSRIGIPWVKINSYFSKLCYVYKVLEELVDQTKRSALKNAPQPWCNNLYLEI